ncbi:hypothetical protein Syun_011129 [Stephania yunnanensis]|uniref:Histone acetyltransferase n=1 Tax=Stephania yunnanensis TaxID=152371 RepID=A0AAP0PG72_9MAGN
MPRPGPRPYECVRRAWHSERHKPIRGSLIQEIFRVVNESHSSATKRNKEWQVKLPIVVLKAEEIMYSKANSEAEYLDHKTLWDRINDAINTIIRREESSETGDLLQPCIEAALILGCTARRTSRSQRNSTPRCYLNPTSQDQTFTPITPRTQNSAVHGGGGPSQLPVLHAGNSTSSPPYLQYHSNISRSTTMNTVPIGLESSCSPVSQDNNNNPTMPPRDFPFSSVNLYPSGINQHFPLEHTFAKLGRVFPLFYGAHSQTIHPLFDSQSTHQSSNHDNAPLLGKPQVQSIQEPVLYACEGIADTTSRIRQVNLSSTSGASADIECDLSLRLGSLSGSCASAETRLLLDQYGDVGRCTSRGVRFCDPSSTKDGGDLYFFNNDNADGNVHRFSSNWCSQNLSLSLGGPSRKRKPSDDTDLIEYAHSSPKPKSLTNLFFGRMS